MLPAARSAAAWRWRTPSGLVTWRPFSLRDQGASQARRPRPASWYLLQGSETVAEVEFERAAGLQALREQGGRAGRWLL
jgi:hypothetical protein